MKIFNLAGAHLALSGNLPYGGAKMKKFKIKWGLLPMSGGFTFCINQTKGEIMIKTKKKNLCKSTTYKKVCFLEGGFSAFRDFYLMKGEKDERID